MKIIQKRYALILSIFVAGGVLADTPERLADPDGLRESLPWLAEQTHWTELATPEEIALYEGPETEWKTVPESEYDLSGFNPAILGSPVPPVGVHPRVLFSPEDLPAIRERFVGSKNQLTAGHILATQLWNPEAPDYQWYHKLATGALDGMEFEDPAAGVNGNHRFRGIPSQIYITHAPHIPRILASAAAYALFTGDEARSRELATVVANYYKLREPIVDAQNERGTPAYVEKYKRGEVEQKPWPNDLWRGMHLICGEENVGLAYDYTANWMNGEQKSIMRRYISKATAGKRAYGQNGPVRWRDTNWVGWDLTLPLTALAIEGEEGFDLELLAVAETTVDGYMTYGISPYGTILETNGKNGAGYSYALKTSIALARRGHRNFFGHPYLRKLSASQVHQIAPAGGWNVNNGTYGCSLFRQGHWLAAAYPNDAAHNWMLREGVDTDPVDLETYAFRLQASREELRARGLDGVERIRCDVIFDDWLPVAKFSQPGGKAAWERDHLGLALDFEDPHHGQFTTRSANAKEALFMMIEARPDLYVGGHQHHDAGHFYLAADGVAWGIESHEGNRTSTAHSVILIDGKGQGTAQHCAPARVEWQGADVAENTAFARMNLKNGYDAIWTTPMHYSWTDPEAKEYTWRPETDPYVVNIFRGTQKYKARVWMHSYWNWNWGPTMRADYNPVRYAYRTAGIVRGQQPYAVVVDDIRKDDAEHLYTWQFHIPVAAMQVGTPDGGLLLALGDTRKEGEPLLWIKPVGPGAENIEARLEPIKQGQKTGQRLVLETTAVDPKFRTLILPLRSGEVPPKITAAADGSSVDLVWPDRTDKLSFSERDNQTRIQVARGGAVIGGTK